MWRVLFLCLLVVALFHPLLEAAVVANDAKNGVGGMPDTLGRSKEKGVWWSRDYGSGWPGHEAKSKTEPQMRHLLQSGRGRSDDAEYVCSLSNQQRRAFLDSGARTWRLDDEALRQLGNDLQSVVNCTSEGDVVLFDSSRRIRPSSRVTIPWNLTLSGFIDDTEIGDDGVFPQTTKVSFTCPAENEGIFFIRAEGVLLANLEFEQCNMSRNADGIIEIDTCSAESLQGSIQLHHVAFQSNELHGGAGLRVNAPSCSRVEMIDVDFEENGCGGVCFALLSMENTLQDIRIARNVHDSGSSVPPVLLTAPSGSQSIAERITAVENQGTVLEITSGTLNLLDSEFVDNTAFVARGADAVSSCAELVNVTAVIENTVFENNTGALGSVIHAEQSSLTLINTTFQSNTATRGGALYIERNSSLQTTRSFFTSNSANEHGGVVYALDSEIQDSISSFSENSAVNSGGCLFLKSSRLATSEALVISNRADFGGFVVLETESIGSITNSTFRANRADLSGGTCFVEDSELSVTQSRFERGNSPIGGFLFFARSQADCADSVFLRGSASSGGGILARQRSEVSIQNVTLSQCEAQDLGGALHITRSSLTSIGCRFASNHARQAAGAVYSMNATLTIQNAVFLDNGADVSAGGIYVGDRGVLEVLNSSFSNHTAQFGGAIVAETGMRGNVQRCTFSKSSSEINGGDCYIAQSEMTFILCRFVQSRARFGGSLHAAERARLNVNASVFVECMGERGGCLNGANSTIRLNQVSVNNSTASERGGAVYVERSAFIFMMNSIFASNEAGDHGGAIFSSRSEVDGDALSFIRNKAGTFGGALYSEESSSLFISNAQLDENSAEFGGAFSFRMGVSGDFMNTSQSKNRASRGGGVGHLHTSTVRLSEGRVSDNRARFGGCFHVSRSTIDVRRFEFRDGSNTTFGGFIRAVDNSTVDVRQTSMHGGRSSYGGAVALDTSHFRGRQLQISECSALKDAGAILVNDTSSLLCTDCLFENSHATERGGAISIESLNPQGLIVQLDNCTIRNNSADCGGAINFVSRGTNGSCTGPGANCSFLVMTDTTLANNSATLAGGAILASDLAEIRFICTPSSDRPRHSYYQREEWETFTRIRRLEDLCPSWVDNQADLYGPTIASYARAMKKTIDYEDGREPFETIENHHSVSNHSSGASLPSISLELVDEFGQGPAVLSVNITVEAAISSPDNFIIGAVNIALRDGSGRFPRIPGFQPSGTYRVHIDFNLKFLSRFELPVTVRECGLGEEASDAGSLCVPCNTATYNHFPENTLGCTQCPDDAICEARLPRPRKGYWHKSPCSIQFQKCFTEEACDEGNRDNKLTEIGNRLENCTVNAMFAAEYSQAQCKKGHFGPLCGSCDASFGKTRSLTCEECFTSAGSVFLVFLSLVILLGLSSFTVRSNLVSYMRRGRRRTLPAAHSPPSYPSATFPSPVVVNEQMVEMMVTGRIPQDVRYSSSPSIGRTDHLAKKAELARWKSVELFKITVNFLQVTAVAISINVDWERMLTVLFSTADFIGGATSNASSRGISCLVSRDSSVPRAVIVTLIDLSMPIAVISLLTLLWCEIAFKTKQDLSYITKRFVLSVNAVFYISYISITKTLIDTLNCVEVHDSLDILNDSRTSYWAVDTSVRCYRGSHAALAGAVGYPLLVFFTIGFPVTVASFVVKNVKGDVREGWIYDVAGFMYRSYSKKYVYWESIIMLRKAVLAAVVVFAYPLGSVLQGVLSVFVLALASYFHTVFRPYRKEFDVLNGMEGASLLVSLITFVSSLLFADDNISHGIRITATVLVFLCNIGTFLFFLCFFMVFSSDYLKAVLEREGVQHRQDGGPYHIYKVYFVGHVLATMRKAASQVYARASRVSLEQSHAPSDGIPQA